MDFSELNTSLSYITANIEDISNTFTQDKKNIAKAISYIYSNMNALSDDTNSKIHALCQGFDNYNENIINLRLSINNTNNLIKTLNQNITYMYADINKKLNNISNSKSCSYKIWHALKNFFMYIPNKIKLRRLNRLAAEEARKQKEYEETLRIEQERQRKIREEQDKKLKEEEEQKRISNEARDREIYEKKRAKEIENKRKQIQDILSGKLKRQQ